MHFRWGGLIQDAQNVNMQLVSKSIMDHMCLICIDKLISQLRDSRYGAKLCNMEATFPEHVDQSMAVKVKKKLG